MAISQEEHQEQMESVMICPKCNVSMKTRIISPDVAEFAVYQCPVCLECLMG